MVNVEGFVFNVEGEKGGNLISLLNMRGNLSAEVKNWQEKVVLFHSLIYTIKVSVITVGILQR